MNWKEKFALGILGTAIALTPPLLIDRTYRHGKYNEATRQVEAVTPFLQAGNLYNAQTSLNNAQTYLMQEKDNIRAGNWELFIKEPALMALEARIKTVEPFVRKAEDQKQAYEQAVAADVARAQQTLREAQKSWKQPKLNLIRQVP